MSTSRTRQPVLQTHLHRDADPRLRDTFRQLEAHLGLSVVMQTERGAPLPVRINAATHQLEVYRAGLWCSLAQGAVVLAGLGSGTAPSGSGAAAVSWHNALAGLQGGAEPEEFYHLRAEEFAGTWRHKLLVQQEAMDYCFTGIRHTTLTDAFAGALYQVHRIDGAMAAGFGIDQVFVLQDASGEHRVGRFGMVYAGTPHAADYVWRTSTDGTNYAERLRLTSAGVLSVPGLTAGRVLFTDTGGALAEEPDLTWTRATDVLYAKNVKVGAGATAAPSLGFAGDPDTGRYLVSDGNMRDVVGGHTVLDYKDGSLGLLTSVTSVASVYLLDTLYPDTLAPSEGLRISVTSDWRGGDSTGTPVAGRLTHQVRYANALTYSHYPTTLRVDGPSFHATDAPGTYTWAMGLWLQPFTSTGAAAVANQALVYYGAAPAGAGNNYYHYAVNWRIKADGTFLLGSGSAAAPVAAFLTDPDAGWFLPAAGKQAWSIGGAECLRLTAAGLGLGLSGNDPAYPLHVTGGDTSTPVAYLTRTSNANASRAAVFTLHDSSHASATALGSGIIFGTKGTGAGEGSVQLDAALYVTRTAASPEGQMFQFVMHPGDANPSTVAMLGHNANWRLGTTEGFPAGGTTPDGTTAGVQLIPAMAKTGVGADPVITRHDYIALNNPTLSNVTLTDACAFSFDAPAGAHKAVDGGSTKAHPGVVDAWLKVNLNGSLGYLPIYSSKTA